MDFTSSSPWPPGLPEKLPFMLQQVTFPGPSADPLERKGTLGPWASVVSRACSRGLGNLCSCAVRTADCGARLSGVLSHLCHFPAV